MTRETIFRTRAFELDTSELWRIADAVSDRVTNIIVRVLI